MYTLNGTVSNKVRAVAETIDEIVPEVEDSRRLQKTDFFNDDLRSQILDLANKCGLKKAALDEFNHAEDSAWKAFKDVFVEASKQLGFQWSRPVGAGGPLVLVGMAMPPSCGEELAKGLGDKAVQSGDILQVLRSEFPNVTKIFKGLGNVDIKPLRESFKDTVLAGTKSYRFSRGKGSVKFHLCGTEYRFPGGKNAETKLGDEIRPKVKAALSLDCLNHVQTGRRYGQYQNLDLEGFKIDRGLDEDLFHLYSFELKARNSVSYISQAISQAVNYLSNSNFTYIVIPNFTADSFFDEDRYNDLIRMCKENGLGVISVECSEDQVDDVIEILEAPYSTASNNEKLLSLIKGSNWEKCQVCRRIAHLSEDRLGCGWKVTVDSDEVCMKRMMEEEQIARYRNRNLQEIDGD